MTTEQPRGHQHPVTQDIPLPGHYPCLTMQLNVTRYQSAGTLRWVLTVREPTLGFETSRAHAGALHDTTAARGDLLGAIEQALANMRWMQAADTD